MTSSFTAAFINDSVFSGVKDQSLLKTGAFIGNEWVDAEEGERYEVWLFSLIRFNGLHCSEA